MPPSFVRQYIEKLETRMAELEKAAATMNELREAAEIDAIRQAMRVSALEAENQRLRNVIAEAGEAFDATCEGNRVNFYYYAKEMRAALLEGE